VQIGRAVIVGHRCFIEFYALLAWPLAKAIEYVWDQRKWWWRGGIVAVLIGFAYLNLKLTTMYSPPWDGPEWTFERYWAILKAALKFWN
jgi:hypothetical protein